MMAMASAPPQLTHINTDGMFIKIWAVTKKEQMDYVRDIIDVYAKKLNEGFGTLRSLSELIPGKIVLAYHNELFHRAEVIQLNSTQTRKVVVNLLDLGVCTSVDCNEIRLADGIFSTISRNGLAEEFILQRAIVRRRWTPEELNSVNLCLSHCTEAVFTGIVCDKRLVTIAINVNSSLMDFSSFLANAGLAELVTDEQMTSFLQSKYGREVPTNQFRVPPPSIMNPNVQIPPSFAIPQQTPIRSVVPPVLNNEPPPAMSSYHRIRTPKPPPTQLASQVQTYIYPTLQVGSTHEVCVSHVIDGMSAFTIQLKDVVESTLPRLMAKINDIRPVPYTDPLGPGTICLGRYTQDNSLCRAVVSNVLAEGANLYFVDFGNSEVVPFNEIYRIPTEFLQEPTMAMRFSLADLSSNYSLTTNEASDIFSDLVLREDSIFTLKVTKSEVPSKQNCELFLPINDKLINIKNKVLDKVKLMKPVEYKKISFKKNQIADVIISYAESPMRFYAQLEVNQTMLEYLMKCVENYCTTAENKDIIYEEDVNENMAVCAKYEDDKWYRGQIVDEPDAEGNVGVFYVDYGNQDSVHFSQLRIMNNEMMSQFPMQSIECRLDVDPSITCTPEVNDVFVNLVDGQCFKMSVKNILPAMVLLVDLFDAEGGSVADQLKDTLVPKPNTPPISPAAYSAPPRPHLQKSQSGNWREKNAPVSNNVDGDFTSFRSSEHDDRGRGKNYDSRRRDSDGIDTTDDARCKKGGDFWGRDKSGPRPERHPSDSGEPWRKDRYQRDDDQQQNDRPDRRPPPRNRFDQEEGHQNDRFQRRDQDDGGRRPYRRRDEDSSESKYDSSRPSERRGSQDGKWGDKPGGDRFQRRDQDDGGRRPYRRRDEDSGESKFDDNRQSENRGSQEGTWGDKPGGDRRFDKGNRGRDGWDKKTSDEESHGGRPRRDNDFGGGWKGKREDGGFNDNRGPRRDTGNSWSNNREEKSNDTWGDSQTNDGNSWNNTRSDDRFGNRREGGFKKRDGDSFSQNTYDRGPRKWEDRSAPALLDGFEKGAQLTDTDYQPSQEMDAVITWFVNPVRFYVMPADNADFRTLMEEVQAEYPKRKTLDLSDVSTNDCVMARDKDNVIYRATVLRTSPRGVVVTFVDYGNTETVGKNQVWAIGPDHCAIPKQAICCSLFNIAPADENGVWKETSEYDTYFSRDSFKLTFVQCVEEENSKTWLVNMADPDGKDIADQLVADNLAFKKVVLSSEELYDINILLHQTISVFLGAADSAKRFFVHIEPPKADHIRTCIETLMENPQGLVPLTADKIVAGEFCLAASSDNAYYRALILSENQTEKQAHVLFIDYGDECDVAFDVITTLPDYLQIYNAQAVECCLFESESFTNDDEFIKAIEEKDFIIKVMDVKDNKLHVKVFDVNGAQLPYPVESDETVPTICPLSIVRPVETVMISSMTQDKVYLQRVSDQNALNDLNTKLFEKYETEGEKEKVAVEPGKFYAAKSAQFEAWYRCQLIPESDGDKVIYIDYGNTEPVESLLAVKPLDEEFFSMPACCVGVKTSAVVKSESVETLLIAVQDNVFKGTFKNTGPGEWFVDLETSDGKNFADCVVETDSGTKSSTELEKIYNAFADWQLQEEKKVKISSLYSPTRFHLQLEEDAVKLDGVRDQLEEALKLVLPMVGKSDDLCAAKSADDGKWYRCRQTDNIAVDYGFVVNATSYKKLPSSYSADRSKYIAECRLNVDAPGTEWNEAAIARFKELVKPENEIVAKLEFHRNRKIVDLSSNGNSIAEILVNEDVAKYQSYDVVISHVTSLSEFYIQEKEVEQELFDILEQLTQAENWETVKPEQGEIVAAKFADDEQWYRAEVSSISEEGITVRFIDYGNESICEEFRALPDDLKSKPKFASLCCVHPLPENAEELAGKFAEFVEAHAETPFSVYFLSRVEPMLVMLYFEGSVIEELLQDKPAPTIVFETVSVVHINSPSSFYVQTETPLLDTVAAELENVESTEPVTNTETGKIYAVKFVDDGVWYRAKAIEGGQVLFIDYGNTSQSDDVRNLPESLKNTPFLAKHCAIPTPAGLDQWPEVATVRFGELTCDGNTVFKMSIIEEGDPAYVELRDDGVNVMDELNTLCQAEKTAPSKVDDKPAVVLSYITSLKEIWVQEQTPALDELADELANVDGFDTLETAEPNTIVAALFDEDGVWYRAKVLENLDDGFNVLFIDFGNESSVTQIKSLPEDLTEMPAFATRSTLAGLPDEADQWPEQVLGKLKEISETVSVFSLVEKVEDNGVWRVTLRYENDKNLTDELLKFNDELSNSSSAAAVGVVSDAKSVTEFHIQSDPRSVEETQNSIQNSESTENAEPVVGSIVSALNEADGTWYRSKVESLGDDKESCEVTRIDFGGNFVTKKWTHLPEEVANTPAKAFKCSLTLPSDLKDEELPEATEKFLNLVNDTSAFAYEIDGCENDVTNVRLFVNGVNVLDLLFPGMVKPSEKEIGSLNDEIPSESVAEDKPTADVETVEHAPLAESVPETDTKEGEISACEEIVATDGTKDVAPNEEIIAENTESSESKPSENDAVETNNDIEPIEETAESEVVVDSSESSRPFEPEEKTEIVCDTAESDTRICVDTELVGQSNETEDIEQRDTEDTEIVSEPVLSKDAENIESEPVEETNKDVTEDVQPESIIKVESHPVTKIENFSVDSIETEEILEENPTGEIAVPETDKSSEISVEREVEVPISQAETLEISAEGDVETPIPQAETSSDYSVEGDVQIHVTQAEVHVDGESEAAVTEANKSIESDPDTKKSEIADTDVVAEIELEEEELVTKEVNIEDDESVSTLPIEDVSVDTPTAEDVSVDTPTTEDVSVNAPSTEDAFFDTRSTQNASVDTPTSESTSVDTPSTEESFIDTLTIKDVLVGITATEDKSVGTPSTKDAAAVFLKDDAVTPLPETSNVEDTLKSENNVAAVDASHSHLESCSSDSRQQETVKASFVESETVDETVSAANNEDEIDSSGLASNDVAEEFNDTLSEKYSDNASEISKFGSSLNVSAAGSVYLSMDDEPETDSKKESPNVSVDSGSTCVNDVEVASNVENSDNASENDDKACSIVKPKSSAQKTKTEKSSFFKGDHQFTVSYVENPGNFYVQKTVDAKRLNALEKQLQIIGESGAELSNVKIGSLVGAKIENCYVRAKVIDEDDFSGCMVFCIDYGTETKSKKLFELPPKLKTMPPMVKRCGLPLPAHLNNWPPDVSVEFEEITQIGNPTFVVTPIDENDDISYVNLTRKDVNVWNRINELCQNYDDD